MVLFCFGSHVASDLQQLDHCIDVTYASASYPSQLLPKLIETT